MTAPVRGGSASSAHSPGHRPADHPQPTWGKTMLKQILATTTVIAIAIVSVQSANAASGKLRQLVVEPAGASADPLLLKKKRLQLLLAQPSQGIPTPAAGGSDGKKVATFIVAPNGGIPTPAGNDGGGNGKGKGKQVAEFVVAPTDGIPTPTGGAGNGAGNGGGKKFVPLLLKPSNGIKVASADPAAPTGAKAFPLI